MTPVESTGDPRAVGGLGGVEASRPSQARLVIVPRWPGRLRSLSWASFEVDRSGRVADRLFGDVTTERRGPLDLVLVVLGAGIVIWSIAADASTGLLAGVASIVLGGAIPARDALHALDRRSAPLRDAIDRRRGLPLDVEEPTVARLVAVYEQVMEVSATLSGPRHARRVRRHAHAAIRALAASLVDGRPDDVAERQAVRATTRALRHVIATRGSREAMAAAVAALLEVEAHRGLG